MSTSSAAFLSAIAANPDDENARLIYADWLDEQGDPQGEFIRIQIERTKPDTSPERWEELTARENELYLQHKKKWTAELKKLGVSDFGFRRGLIETIGLNVKYLDNGPAILDACPTIRSISFREIKSDVPKFVQSEWLRRVPSIDLMANHLGYKRILEVAECEYLDQTIHLNLGENGMRAPGFAAIANSPHLEKLQSLYVSGTSMASAKGLGDAGRGLIWQHVKDFMLEDSSWENEHFVAFAEGLDSPRWEKLHLSCYNCGDEGLTALARHGALTHLKALTLISFSIRGPGVCEVLQSQGALKRFSLEQCVFDAAATEAIVQPAPLWKTLDEIYFVVNREAAEWLIQTKPETLRQPKKVGIGAAQAEDLQPALNAICAGRD